MDGAQENHGDAGMSASEMGRKHQKEATTSDIEVQNASISVVPNQIWRIGVATGSNGPKSLVVQTFLSSSMNLLMLRPRARATSFSLLCLLSGNLTVSVDMIDSPSFKCNHLQASNAA
jgi:spore maturation protein SpmA